MLSPRVTASRATPAPTTPPPTTRTSSSSSAPRPARRARARSRAVRAERARTTVHVAHPLRRFFATHRAAGVRHYARAGAGRGRRWARVAASAALAAGARHAAPRGLAEAPCRRTRHPPRARPRSAPRPRPPGRTRAADRASSYRHAGDGRRPALAQHGLVERRRGPRTTDRARQALRLRPDVRGAPAADRPAPTWRCATRRCRSRRPGQPAAELPGLRGAARGRRPGSARSGSTPARPRPTTASTRGTTAWSAPPTCSSAPGSRHVGTFRTAAERRRPVILTTDGRRAGRRRGRDLRHQRLPAARGARVVGLAVGRGRTCWPRPAPPAGPARTSWSCTCTAATSTTTCPTPPRSTLVERLTRSPDVDLVLGEHAHVVQPITKVNGKWVVYGMGNMVAQQDPGRAGHLPGDRRAVHASPSGAAAGSRSPGRRTSRSAGTSGTPVADPDPAPGPARHDVRARRGRGRRERAGSRSRGCTAAEPAHWSHAVARARARRCATPA